MAKFLIEASYTPEGLKGLQKDKASGRLEAVSKAAQSLGGALESLHYALGQYDVVLVVDLPDTGAAAAFAAAASGSGLVRTRTTALLTVAEMDQALGRSLEYRPPGR